MFKRIIEKILTIIKKDDKINDKTFYILDQIVEFEDEIYHPIIITKGKYKDIIFILINISEYIIVANPRKIPLDIKFDNYVLSITNYMKKRFV